MDRCLARPQGGSEYSKFIEAKDSRFGVAGGPPNDG